MKRASHSGENGQAATELAVLVALIAIALIVALIVFRTSVSDIVFRSGEDATGVFKPPTPTCDPNYSGACIPPSPPPVDCDYLQKLGITQFTVSGSDPDNLDPDGDGIGCN